MNLRGKRVGAIKRFHGPAGRPQRRPNGRSSLVHMSSTGANRTPSALPFHCVNLVTDDITDDDAMGLALTEAARASEHGDVPVGAIALVGGKVVSRAHNRREVDGDPTAHAELLVLREAAAALGRWRLDDVTVVVTLEPCPMCAGALVAGRVARVVFGVPDPKAGACGSLYNLCVDPRLNHEVAVTAGVRAAEAAALLTDFFKDARRPG